MDKKEIAQGVVKGAGGLISRLGKLMPQGMRNPDSMIRNRSLYIGNGHSPKPTTGEIYTGTALLTGVGPRRRVVRRRRR